MMNSTLFGNRPSGDKQRLEEPHRYEPRQDYPPTHNVHSPEDRAGEKPPRHYHLPLPRQMMTLGAIGWAIIVPSLLGAALGLWIDTLWPGNYSWFSLLLPLGILIGCLTALLWSRSDSL